MFDVLSFWMTMYKRELKRTFALVPEQHQVQRLGPVQFQAHKNRLISDSKVVQARYQLLDDDLYKFLNQLLGLHLEYQDEERYKLSEELRSEIISLARFIGFLSGNEWESIADELGERYGGFVKQHFQHLDILSKEQDEAQDLLKHFAAEALYLAGDSRDIASFPRSRFSYYPAILWPCSKK